MYAVVKIGGSQYRVNVGDTITTQKIIGDEGSEVMFDKVLLLSDESKTMVGTPMLSGAFVKAVVSKQGREKTIDVVKFKRRKGIRRKNGHRQHFTRLQITEISNG